MEEKNKTGGTGQTEDDRDKVSGAVGDSISGGCTVNKTVLLLQIGSALYGFVCCVVSSVVAAVDGFRDFLSLDRLPFCIYPPQTTQQMQLEQNNTSPLTKARPHSLVVRQCFLRRGSLAAHDLHVRRLLKGKLISQQEDGGAADRKREVSRRRGVKRKTPFPIGTRRLSEGRKTDKRGWSGGRATRTSPLHFPTATVCDDSLLNALTTMNRTTSDDHNAIKDALVRSRAPPRGKTRNQKRRRKTNSFRTIVSAVNDASIAPLVQQQFHANVSTE